jgi:hypothetical protein
MHTRTHTDLNAVPGILQISLSRLANRVQINSVGTPSIIGFVTSLCARTGSRRFANVTQENARFSTLETSEASIKSKQHASAHHSPLNCFNAVPCARLQTSSQAEHGRRTLENRCTQPKQQVSDYTLTSHYSSAITRTSSKRASPSLCCSQNSFKTVSILSRFFASSFGTRATILSNTRIQTEQREHVRELRLLVCKIARIAKCAWHTKTRLSTNHTFTIV